MAEHEVDGVRYQLAKLDAMTQFHVSRRLMPIMGSIQSVEGGDENGKKVFTAIGVALSNLSDADTEYVINKCLANCRRQNGDVWARVYVNGQLMFDDIGMMGMIKLTFETLKDNLSGFFTGLGSNLAAAAAS